MSFFRFRLYVRNNLWIVPAIFVFWAILLSQVVPSLDQNLGESVDIGFDGAAARTMLAAIAAGMITFTGFVFSIVLVAIQFGSSHFSPRLRVLVRDRSMKLALGTFVATFIYALLVIGQVQPADDPSFVPNLSVAVAVLLLLASVAMFINLIHKTAKALRVASVVSSIAREGGLVIDGLYPQPATGPESEHEPQGSADTAESFQAALHLERSGVLRSIDQPRLVRTATRAGAEVVLVPAVGDFVPAGTPLFYVFGGRKRLSHRSLRRSIALGDERTIEQDPRFALRLLVDIANKGLSPGINDPTTAVQTLDQIEALLRQIASRRLDIGEVRDRDGQLRLHFPAPTWEDFVELGIGEIRRYGEGSPQVARRLRALLEDLLEEVPSFRRAAVRDQMRLLELSVKRSFRDADERQRAARADRQGIGSTRTDGVFRGVGSEAARHEAGAA